MFRSGIIVTFFTLLSRIFGLIREFFIAALFGTSQIADCVNIAFKFPNLFRRIFGEGALSVVFIPMYTQKFNNSENEAHIFSGKVLSLLLLVLVLLTIILEILMPYLMLIIAPGFFYDDAKFNLAIILCRITTPYLIFVSIVALFGGMLNSVRKFAAFAFSPIILSICVILFTNFTKDIFTAHYSISYSLILAGILQILFMIFCLAKANIMFKLSFDYKDKEVRKLVTNMGPAALSSSAQQLNLFISHSIASFLPGAISILSYADRLYQLPLALIGIAFATVLLPELSNLYKDKNYVKANELQNKAIKMGMSLAIPATIGLFLLAYPIIHVIFERGEFTNQDSLMTAKALAVFSLGLPAFIISKIITPIFYANGDTKTPLRITIYSIVINSFLNILLMLTMGYLGIALGSAISGWINSALLVNYSRIYGNFKITHNTKLFVSKIVLSSIIMGIFILSSKNYFTSVLINTDNVIIKCLTLTIIIVMSIVIFMTGTYFFKLHKEFYQNYDNNRNAIIGKKK